jgi:hypothetical protein
VGAAVAVPAPGRLDGGAVMAYVIVEDFFSRCSACGGNADPDEDHHVHGGPSHGYQRGSETAASNGCGAPLTHHVNNEGQPIKWAGAQ